MGFVLDFSDEIDLHLFPEDPPRPRRANVLARFTVDGREADLWPMLEPFNAANFSS